MKVLTANRLLDGEAVWLAPGNVWAETLQAAELARDPEHQQRLSDFGKASAARNEVLDLDLIDVELVDGRIVPLRLRERIRAGGPSIHPELGKQARRAFAPTA